MFFFLNEKKLISLMRSSLAGEKKEDYTGLATKVTWSKCVDYDECFKLLIYLVYI